MSPVLANSQQPESYDLNVAQSNEYQAILVHLNNLAETYNFPESRQQDNYVQRFYSLVETWRNDLKNTASVTDAALHPAYQQIIGMGEKAIPLILKELDEKPLYWFWAIKAITCIDPVASRDRGKVQKMKEAWLDWAKAQGYEWQQFS